MKGVNGDWKRGTGSIAKEDTPCAGFRCNRTISKGEGFSYHKAGCGYHNNLRLPFCLQCKPFIVVASNDYDVLIPEYKQTPQGAKDYIGDEGWA